LGIDAAAEDAGDEGRIGVGPLAQNAPGATAGEAVDGVLERSVVGRNVVVLAVPGEATVADAVGEREQDGNAAARRASVAEEVRVGVEQVEGPAAEDDLPREAVEAKGRPDFRPSALAVLQDVDGGVELADPRLRACADVVG